MMQFHETEMGKRFFQRQLPGLIGSLTDIAAALKTPAPVYQLQQDIPEDVLEALYYGNFAPAAEPDNASVKAFVEDILCCEESLKAAVPRETWGMIETYRGLLDRRGIAECVQAFADGFRAATKLIAAGLSVPVRKTEAGHEQPQ